MARHGYEPTAAEKAAAAESARRIENALAGGRAGDAHARTQEKLDRLKDR